MGGQENKDPCISEFVGIFLNFRRPYACVLRRLFSVGKIARKQSERVFVNSALNIQCHVVKNTAFSAILPTAILPTGLGFQFYLNGSTDTSHFNARKFRESSHSRNMKLFTYRLFLSIRLNG